MFHKNGVEIWSRGMQVWALMACRANSQGGRYCPWKPSCPWRDATNRWLPVIYPSKFTEKCCQETCKMKAWISREIAYYTVFLSQGPAIFWLSLQKIVEATLWAQKGLRKRAWNRKEGGKAQLSKEWHSPRASHELIKIKWVQDGE